MRRSEFLLLAAATAAWPRRADAQNDFDPATTSAQPALRVLLGPGEAVQAGDGTFTFDGRLFRGSFSRLDNGEIVNVVDLEAYLRSVVPAEMPRSWAPSALQSQAICARTYVLARSDPRRQYDLVPSELDQVYRGIEGESAEAGAAVEATRGRVLRYGTSFARVAYSSCCGGHTEASSEAWGNVPIPYLQGVVCTSCAPSPHFRWSTTLALGALGAALAQPLAGFGTLDDVRPGDRDPSGRVRNFELEAATGSTTLPGGAFRRAVGARVLPSLLVFRMMRSADGSGIAVDGGGLGHGVGLCQWGAQGMALAGATPAQILGLYFPGTVVADLD